MCCCSVADGDGDGLLAGLALAVHPQARVQPDRHHGDTGPDLLDSGGHGRGQHSQPHTVRLLGRPGGTQDRNPLLRRAVLRDMGDGGPGDEPRAAVRGAVPGGLRQGHHLHRGTHVPGGGGQRAHPRRSQHRLRGPALGRHHVRVRSRPVRLLPDVGGPVGHHPGSVLLLLHLHAGLTLLPTDEEARRRRACVSALAEELPPAEC